VQPQQQQQHMDACPACAGCAPPEPCPRPGLGKVSRQQQQQHHHHHPEAHHPLAQSTVSQLHGTAATDRGGTRAAATRAQHTPTPPHHDHRNITANAPPAAVAVAAGTVTAASLDSDLVCIGIVIAKALAFPAADAAAAAAAIAAAIYVMMHAIRIAFPVEYRSWHGEEVKIERRARESRAERRRQKVLAGTWEAEQAAKRKLEEVGSDR